MIEPGPPPAPAANDRTVAGLIFATLCLLYLLTFSGVFRTVDELAMYASTESLAQRGDLSTPQILFSDFHNPTGPIEPGQAALAAPLYWLAQRFPTVNNIQAVMLLNPLVTALTAAALYRIGRALGYAHGACLGLAFAFGLATLAWPYSRSFLREPLLGLIVTLAFYSYVTFRRRPQARWLAATLGLLAAATATKFIAIALVPFFLIPAAGDWIRLHPQHKRRVVAGSFAFVLVAFAAALLIATLRLQQEAASSLDVLASFVRNLSLSNVLEVAYGLLFSPGKGIVFYSPMVVIGWLGVAGARPHRRLLAWFSLLVPGMMMLAYSGSEAWYGGQSWGPRFLVPVVPLMLLPALERMSRRSTWVLIAISVALQIGAVSADWALAHKPLNRISRPFETTIGLDPAYWHLSPAFNQIRFWTSDRADLLWAHPQASGGFHFDPILPFGLVALATLSAVLLWRTALRRARPVERWTWPVLVLAGAGLLLGRGWQDTPDYPGMSLDEARAVAGPVSVPSSAGNTYVTVSNEFHIYFMLGLMKGSFQHFWYSPAQHDNFVELDASADRSRPVTLTIDRVHLPPEESGYELRNWLNLRAYQFGGGFIGGYERMGYVWGPDPAQLQPVGERLGNLVSVDAAGIGGQEFAPGAVIPVQTELRKLGELPNIMIVTLRLEGDNGRVIGGHNGPVQFGAIDLGAWPVDTAVIDRRGFPIPHDAPGGQYSILLGVETLEGVLKTGAGQEFVTLGQIRIR